MAKKTNKYHLPKIETHPLKQEIYDRLTSGISPYKISKWLKKRGEKEGRNYTISVPVLYKYRKKRRFKTEKQKVKEEIDNTRKAKEIASIKSDIRDINKALKSFDLINLSQSDARSYKELINSKCRLIDMMEKLLRTYDEKGKDISEKMTVLFTRIRQQEESKERFGDV